MSDEYPIGVVKQAFAVLDVLAKGPSGPTEIGAAVGVPKNKAFRLLRTLVELGQVEEVEGVYRLAPRSVRVLGDRAMDAVERETREAVAALSRRMEAFVVEREALA